MSDPSQTTSPLALVSLLTGVMGLAFSFIGCMFSPFLFIAAALCLIAIVIGALEIQKVNAGQSAPNNRTYALAGIGSGLGGCALGLLYVVVVFLFVILYLLFVFFLLFAGAVAGSGGP